MSCRTGHLELVLRSFIINFEYFNAVILIGDQQIASRLQIKISLYWRQFYLMQGKVQKRNPISLRRKEGYPKKPLEHFIFLVAHGLLITLGRPTSLNIVHLIDGANHYTHSIFNSI